MVRWDRVERDDDDWWRNLELWTLDLCEKMTP